MYIIEDWAGNLIKSPEFKTFEDGWQWIRETYPNEDDWQEYYVIKK